MLSLVAIVFTISFLAQVTHTVQEFSCTASCPTCTTVSSDEGTQQGHAPSQYQTSCKDIKQKWPSSPSGYYSIANSIGETMTVYCQMGQLCGSDGPWTRIAHLDMSYPTQKCPGSLREYSANGVRVCGRPITNTGSCSSVYFDVPADPYKEVCGRVTGYQFASTSAVDRQSGRSIDTYYVDGVSLTKGFPRQHVWTFMTGLLNNSAPKKFACPCASSTSQTSPSFVGDNYFCEAGNSGPNHPTTLHTADPLWDGKGCGPSEESCCSVPGIPWFHRELTTVSSDYLEMRVCCDQDTTDEDAPIGYYEIYVQ